MLILSDERIAGRAFAYSVQGLAEQFPQKGGLLYRS
jgi:hypothetical protein